MITCPAPGWRQPPPDRAGERAVPSVNCSRSRSWAERGAPIRSSPSRAAPSTGGAVTTRGRPGARGRPAAARPGRAAAPASARVAHHGASSVSPPPPPRSPESLPRAGKRAVRPSGSMPMQFVAAPQTHAQLQQHRSGARHPGVGVGGGDDPPGVGLPCEGPPGEAADELQPVLVRVDQDEVGQGERVAQPGETVDEFGGCRWSPRPLPRAARPSLRLRSPGAALGGRHRAKHATAAAGRSPAA